MNGVMRGTVARAAAAGALAAFTLLAGPGSASAQTRAGDGGHSDGAADPAAQVDGSPQAAASAEAPSGAPVVSFGVGVGSLDLAGVLAVGVRVPPGELVIRSAFTGEIAFFNPAESVWDAAVLYGLRRSGGGGWVRGAVGAALVEVEERGDVTECVFIFCDYERDRSRTVGLAAQADAVWAIARWLGLGVTVFGDLNSKMSFAGATVTVSLGRVR